MSTGGMPSPFVWGRGGRAMSPEQIAREREIAEALMASGADFSPVAHPLEGLARVAQAASGAYRNYRAGQAEEAGASANADIVRGLLGGMGGGSAAPTAASVSADFNVPATASAGSSAAPIAGDTWDTLAPTVIQRLSQDFQLSPEQAAGIVGQLGHESAGLQAINEISPLVPGSRGGFGWAQWTGPRRRAFEAFAAERGLDVTDPEANYAFLAEELRGDEGRRSGVLDAVRQAQDARSAGRAFTDLFLRPGIPGYDSRDQWTDRALAFVGQPAAAPAVDAVNAMAAAPTAVDPATMAAPQSRFDLAENAFLGVPGLGGGRTNQIAAMGQAANASEALAASGGFGGSPAAAMPYAPEAPAMAQPSPVAAALFPSTAGYGYDPANPGRVGRGSAELSPQAQAQLDAQVGAPPQAAVPAQPASAAVAQALMGGSVSGVAPAQAGAPAAAAPSGFDAALMQALSDPRATPQTQRLALALLEQRQAQMQPPDPVAVGGVLVNPRTGEVVFDSRTPEAPDQTSAMQNFEYLTGVLGVDPETALERAFGGGQTINVGGNNDIGTIPQGMMVTRDEAGNVTGMVPIPGGPAAIEAEQAASQQEARRSSEVQTANIVVEDIDRALDIIRENPWTTTGALGSMISSIGGTNAGDVAGLIDTVRANAGFDTLNAMRQSSPTGGALGSVTERELSLLQAAIGNLEQSQSYGQLVRNLERVRNIYSDIIHGPGNRPEDQGGAASSSEPVDWQTYFGGN